MGLREVELPALGLFLVQASDGMAVASMDRRGTAAQSGQVSRYPARAGPAPALQSARTPQACPVLHAPGHDAPGSRWLSGIRSSPSTTLASTTRSPRRLSASAPRCVCARRRAPPRSPRGASRALGPSWAGALRCLLLTVVADGCPGGPPRAMSTARGPCRRERVRGCAQLAGAVVEHAGRPAVAARLHAGYCGRGPFHRNRGGSSSRDRARPVG